MSETMHTGGPPQQPPPLEQAGPSAGVLLRQAREAAGMDIAALAASLKVTIPKLQALEEDDYASLPDAVFARALASSICRTLKIDPAPVLERLPHGVMPRLLPEKPALNTTFRQPGERRMALPAVPRGAALAVLALLFGAAAVYFLPEGVLRWDQASEEGTTVATPPAGSALPLPAQAPDVQEQSGTAPALPLPMASVADVPAPVAAETVAASRPLGALPAPVQQAMATLPTPVAAPSASAAATVASVASSALVGESVLQFVAREQSWVQVRNPAGAVVFERVLRPGESAQVPGQPPWAVVIGNASATEVRVRGHVFDTSSATKVNVARFEVK
ncbi:MAG: DUF4115 domain-containing protein [Acidovorax sp.]|nr:DUF4115 domain-containing protein [Acidovorax sp.]